MHSHDRTLLASLGFADPDKRNPLHDEMCTYLAQESTIRALCLACWPKGLSKPYRGELTAEISAKQESMITKGEGKYMSTIGFADVLVDIEFTGEASYQELENHVLVEKWGVYAFERWTILIEVKATETPITNVIRQLNLYKPHVQAAYHHSRQLLMLLATPYAISAQDAATLANEGVTHVRLGEAFNAWRARPKQEYAGAVL